MLSGYSHRPTPHATEFLVPQRSHETSSHLEDLAQLRYFQQIELRDLIDQLAHLGTHRRRSLWSWRCASEPDDGNGSAQGVVGDKAQHMKLFELIMHSSTSIRRSANNGHSHSETVAMAFETEAIHDAHEPNGSSERLATDTNRASRRVSRLTKRAH